MTTRTLHGCQLGDNNLSPVEDLLMAINENVYSHPDKKLTDHLIGVWNNCSIILETEDLPLDHQLIFLASITHDIGKSAPEFQNYLFHRGKGVNHAFNSAWFTLLLAKEYKIEIGKSIWAAEAVRRHHTRLEDFNQICNVWGNDDLAKNSDELLKRLHDLLPAYPHPLTLDFLQDLQETINLDLVTDLNEITWLQLRLLYSVLISADRMDANDIRPDPKKEFPFSKSLDLNKEKKNNPEIINEWRNQTQTECIQNALSVITTPGVYTLTLPTGAGKTITGLKIAESLIHRDGYSSLIYALPFISIVEQNSDIASEFFGKDIIQEDHSLQLADEDNNNQDNFENNDPNLEYYSKWKTMQVLFRYWNRPIVVTTTAQFWDAIFDPRANHTMNFHRICNSVVILDEPQTIPPQYWLGMGKLFEFLSKQVKSVFIMMTATQPHISQNLSSGEKKQIEPHPYYFPFNRHQYEILDIDHQNPLEYISEVILNNKLQQKRSGLIVLNTKQAALQTYQLLYDTIYADVQVKFLSAWVTPFRRRKILEQLRILEKSDDSYLLISTQVIEAGVDLDFEWVFRDFGPLDSIIQVAGRCNRNYRKNFAGKVYVAELYGETNSRKYSFSRQIYDPVLLEATRKVLIQHKQFDEKDVPAIINLYYDHILSSLNSEDLFKNLKSGKWGKPIDLYPDQREDEITLIIEEDDQIYQIINDLNNKHWDLNNLQEKKKLINKLQLYAIKIPFRYLSSLKLKCSEIINETPVLETIIDRQMYFLRKAAIGEDPDKVYSNVKGYIPPGDLKPAIW